MTIVHSTTTLPNDKVIQHLITHFNEFHVKWDYAWDGCIQSGTENEVQISVAWVQAQIAIRTINRVNVWNSYARAIRTSKHGQTIGAAILLDAIAALIAWDNSHSLLHVAVPKVRHLAKSGNKSAQLMLGAATTCATQI